MEVISHLLLILFLIVVAPFLAWIHADVRSGSESYKCRTLSWQVYHNYCTGALNLAHSVIAVAVILAGPYMLDWQQI